jgi:hypothetical protein
MKVFNAELDGIDTRDYPDFSDAFVAYAEHEDGTALTDDELDTFNDEHRDIVHGLVFKKLF